MKRSEISAMARAIKPALSLAVLATVSLQAMAAATITVVNNDGANEGFNDPTPVAPVGGNPGTTLGAQRLFAFQHAANLWGAKLTSNVTISIRANFDPLTCTATSATLGSAGATQVFANFPGAQQPDTWHSYALANKLVGSDVSSSPGPQISARFNSNLGQANCLAGSPFYLGIDSNHGSAIDLVAVLLHEFGHGLGFQTFTGRNSAGALTGEQFAGLPSIWDHFMLDNTTGKTWVQMTNTERVNSALNFRNLAWTGANVTSNVPNVLSLGTPLLNISGPNAGPTAGMYQIGNASFGPALTAGGVSGQLMPVVAQPGGTGPGCEPFNATNARAVAGNIALIDRGVCGFTIKVKNAQNAGAIGVVIADNAAGSPTGLGGTDATITIPSVRITLADGNALKARLATRSRTASGVIAKLFIDTSQYAGADRQGRMTLYTPNPFIGGSSISHFDTLATRNLLMEPSINADLTQSVDVPEDLTFPLLKDTGW